MNRRVPALASVLVLSVLAPQATALASAQHGSAQPDGRRGDDALRRLEADARGAVRVHRDAQGRVDFVASTDGRAMLAPHTTGSPARSARDQLDRYGEAFGFDGTESRAVVDHTYPSSTGGAVVRAGQLVDDVPVFGGQVVMSLDASGGVVSVAVATAAPIAVSAPVVAEETARRTARREVAKLHQVRAGALVVHDQGRHIYDPALVHVADAGGSRPVWQFEVTNGHDIRETVLVGTNRGEIALHFNEALGLDRVVCDNADDQSVYSFDSVPPCTTPARSEGGAPTGQAEVDAAYQSLGAVSDAYASLDGLDLGEIIGQGAPGSRQLTATVRWCFVDDVCPFSNAFWDGSQMVLGDGFAAADDVVGHELTHGYVERTSALFAFHQSGAINESLADVVGEVVDHRTGTDDDSAWTIGEDAPGGAIRSLADPTSSATSQPDRMTSDRYATADFYDDAGAVHQNDGVGNKTAYLISQGGTFNGRTIAGIDAGDPGLAKTGRLFLEVVPRLTSGSEYADLGRVLVSTCDQLAASATGGFTTADCSSVRSAVAATELDKAPVDPGAAAPEVGVTCDIGEVDVLARDDDGFDGFGWSLGSLWQRTPENDSPSYASSGTSSLFAWDPDPAGYGDPSSSSAVSRYLSVPVNQRTYLHLHHAYLLDYSPASAPDPAAYWDGAQVVIQYLDASGAWATASSLPWVNGPDKTISTSSSPGFGGDSHGYGSSRVELTSLAGKTIRVILRVSGDDGGSLLGWWVDDVRLYTCASRAPSAPRNVRVDAGMNSAVISWDPPSDPGSGPMGYRIWSLSNINLAIPGTSWVYPKPGRGSGEAMPLRIVATAPFSGTASGWLQGPYVSVTVYKTDVLARTSALRVRKGHFFRYYATLTRSPYGEVPATDRLVQLQRSRSRSGPWRTVATRPSHDGHVTWRVSQRRAMYYRVVAPGAGDYFGALSVPQLIRMR